MGANPLDYLDFAAPLRSGFNMGLQVQQQRDNRRLQEEAAADRMIRLEIQRQQENRMMEQVQNAAAARRAMEIERAEVQRDSVGYALATREAANNGATPIDAHTLGLTKYPKAYQAQNSILGLMQKPETKAADKSPVVTGPDGKQYLRPGFKPLTDANKVGELEIKTTPEGLGYTVVDGKVEMLPAGVQEKFVTANQAKQAQIEKQELVISNLEARQKRGVEKVDTTLGFGGRPIKESIEEEKAKLEVMKGNRKAGVPFELPTTPQSTNAPPAATTNAPAKVNLKKGTKRRQGGVIYVFDGTDPNDPKAWNPQ
jgi:hypothetical protein